MAGQYLSKLNPNLNKSLSGLEILLHEVDINFYAPQKFLRKNGVAIKSAYLFVLDHFIRDEY
jgi:hypothetical protein